MLSTNRKNFESICPAPRTVSFKTLKRRPTSDAEKTDSPVYVRSSVSACLYPIFTIQQ